MTIVILPSAKEDLAHGFGFYEDQQVSPGLQLFRFPISHFAFRILSFVVLWSPLPYVKDPSVRFVFIRVDSWLRVVSAASWM
jgi:hypothetical protein